MSGELNYRVDDIQEVIERVKKKYSGSGLEDFTDGYSINHDEWRLNIRSSNTEPLLRLNIEAKREGLVENITEDIEALIKSESK